MRASLNQDPNSTFRFQYSKVSSPDDPFKCNLLYLDFNPVQSALNKIKNQFQNHILGSHCAVNWTDDHCPVVQHALLPLHVDDQRQQGVLHPEREGRSRPCSEPSHDPESLPFHAAAGEKTKKLNLGEMK